MIASVSYLYPHTARVVWVNETEEFLATLVAAHKAQLPIEIPNVKIIGVIESVEAHHDTIDATTFGGTQKVYLPGPAGFKIIAYIRG